jgi:hypothetical protein
MLKFPALNNHVVGVSAVALTIIALGMAENTLSRRAANDIAEISSAQVNQPHWVNPADLESTPNALSSAIPPNAYGSAQATQSEAAPRSAKESDLTATEGKDWSQQEWEIASKAVSAYRAVARAANAVTKSATKSRDVWQPPEEIAASRQVNK